jgi:hypothetical protein
MQQHVSQQTKESSKRKVPRESERKQLLPCRGTPHTSSSSVFDLS